MFDKEIRITGKHGQYMNMLSNNFGETGAKLFNRNIDVYVQAPLVGFLFQRKADRDMTTKDNSGKLFDAHILKDQMITSQDNLTFNMQLILLLDKEHESDEEKRIDKAFRNFGKDENDLELFNSYARGGIEVLYEKLIQGASKPDNFIENLTIFSDDITHLFNDNIDKDQLISLLK